LGIYIIMRLPAVVLDCGTGYTKMGFAGNVEVNSCSVCLLLLVRNFADFYFVMSTCSQA